MHGTSHGLVSSNGSFAYITKRVDQIFDNSGMKILAIEDLCQLSLKAVNLPFIEIFLCGIHTTIPGFKNHF